MIHIIYRLLPLYKQKNHLGSELKRLIEQFSIRSFGIDDKLIGNSSKWLFDKFRISKFTKFAIPGGRAKNNIQFYQTLIEQVYRLLNKLTGNFIVT